MGVAGSAYRTWHIEALGVFGFCVHYLHSEGKAGKNDDKEQLFIHVHQYQYIVQVG